MTPNTIQFYSDGHTEVLRISANGIWANPDIPTDEAAKLVLAALDWHIKTMLTKAIADEREQCAEVCESRETPGTGSVAILRGAADAIRARGKA